jgi:hypothetical protein
MLVHELKFAEMGHGIEFVPLIAFLALAAYQFVDCCWGLAPGHRGG